MSGQRINRADYLRPVTATIDRKLAEANLDRTAVAPSSSRSDTLDGTIRVLLADSTALVRAGYRALLESEERITVIGEAASADEAIAVAMDSHPDVALLDVELPGLGDIEATIRALARAEFAGVAVMLMGAYASDDQVLGAIRAGAIGVLAKDAEPQELTRAVLMLARGQAALSAEVVRRLVSELLPYSLKGRSSVHELEELTDREREVLMLVATGLSNGEIAERLVISPATAKKHVGNAMLKLQVSYRAQLVVLAYETGLVLPRTSSPSPTDRLQSVA